MDLFSISGFCPVYIFEEAEAEENEIIGCDFELDRARDLNFDRSVDQNVEKRTLIAKTHHRFLFFTL